VAVPLVDSLMQRWFVRDLDMRSSVIASPVSEPLSGLMQADSVPSILAYFNRMTRDERLHAVGLCPDARSAPIATSTFPRSIRCSDLDKFASESERVLPSDRGMLHVAVRPVNNAEVP